MRVWRALSNEPKIRLIGKKLKKWRRENYFATKMVLWRHRVKSGTPNKYQLSSFFMLFHIGIKKVWVRIWPTTRHFHPSMIYHNDGEKISNWALDHSFEVKFTEKKNIICPPSSFEKIREIRGVHLKCPQNSKCPHFLPKTRTFSDQQKCSRNTLIFVANKHLRLIFFF